MASSALLLVIFFTLLSNGICNTSFSNQPKLKKTIKTKHDVYDCVDFYKQQAFNHPLLKFNTSKVLPNKIKELQRQEVSGFGLKDGGCPIRTVPILRINQSSSISSVQSSNPKMHCVALVHTNNLNRKFFGVGGSLSVYKPLVQSSDQSTSARIKLSNGGESFEAGWMVNPKVFKDNESHLYVGFKAQGNKDCINLQCPGFVQVARGFPLGAIPPRYSEIGSLLVVYWNISIDKHQDDENWWLTVGDIAIGYWPKLIFTALANVASKVEWGGEIYDWIIKYDNKSP